MQPSSVDLPAPFGPIRHVSEPRSIDRLDVVDRRDRAEHLRDAADLTGEVRGAGLVVGELDYRRNAAPNRALGLHEAILPAHMLSIWIPLWFRGPKNSRPPGVGRRRSLVSSAVVIAARVNPPRCIAAWRAKSAVDASTLNTEIGCPT